MVSHSPLSKPDRAIRFFDCRLVYHSCQYQHLHHSKPSHPKQIRKPPPPEPLRVTRLLPLPVLLAVAVAVAVAVVAILRSFAFVSLKLRIFNSLSHLMLPRK